MSQLSIHSSVGQFVVDQPDRARLFEQIGIDYCCGGKRPLADVCRDKGLDAVDVCRKLLDSIPDATVEYRDWNEAPLSELCDHLESFHRVLLHEDLPRLRELTAKLANAHGERLPKVRAIATVFMELQAELSSHMAKEEMVLFPMIRELEASGRAEKSHCGSISNAIQALEMEHDSAGRGLQELRRLSNGFKPADDACNTHRVMLHALLKLERDLHQHIHEENNILFERVLKLA